VGLRCYYTELKKGGRELKRKVTHKKLFFRFNGKQGEGRIHGHIHEGGGESQWKKKRQERGGGKCGASREKAMRKKELT